MNVITLQTEESSVLPGALISLKNAGVRREGHWLVRGVDLTLAPGEIVTLIGPNGSGKTTTAKMALGIMQADEGNVFRKPGLRVGYVPQNLVIDWTMPLRVKEFMSLTWNGDSATQLAALKRTGASALLDRDLRSLSGGELQRVSLARAIARKPDVLVLDEPVQGVDFNGELELYDLIKSLRNETGCAILMVSHDLHVVMAATDRVICLNGHVCCQGTPENVALSDEYKAMFGGRAAAALAVYQHHHDHTHMADGRVLHSDGTTTDNCRPDDGHHPDGPKHEHHHA
jgi:zinc transport system ATP-binding protein